MKYICWTTTYIYWVYMLDNTSHMWSNIYIYNPIYIPNTYIQHIWTSPNEVYMLDNNVYILSIYVGQHITYVVQHICI